ncbi:hypothetical protein T439DRAFT_312595 [Meredithblackwellia eburnea MCA 4105]
MASAGGSKKLNYDKWSSLELSDDSDIEVHPNVDKKSMIRWKQRDIHEKREMRKLKLHHLGQEKIMNQGLLKRIESLTKSLKEEGPPFVSRTVSELRAKVPDYDNKKFKDGEQPSEDHMILSLLTQVVAAVEKDGKGEAGRGDRLLNELAVHEHKLEERQVQVDQEAEEIEKEQKKHITSDDIHVGFDSKTMISSTPSAAPQAPKSKIKEQKTVIETINSPPASTSAPGAAPPADDSDGSDPEEEAATLTPAATAFSHIKPLDFPAALKAISENPSLLQESTTDALLVEAFSAAMKGKDDRARQCVEKGLMIQYCLQLGRDGVALYFRRMTGDDPRALKLFLEDVASTGKRIIDRARVVAKERDEEREANGEGVEQIQLVATEPGTTISFEVPDGPPPEKLEITGEGSEELDPELVREFLQKRWDIFQAFPKNLQKALAEKSLEKVNKVLGKMSVEDAEEVVNNLQEGGILSFESGGIRDETGGASGSKGAGGPAVEAETAEVD